MYADRLTLFALLLGLFLAAGCSTVAPMTSLTSDSRPVADATVMPAISVNAEEEEEPQVWEGLFEAVATATGGNTNTHDVDVKAEITGTWEVDRFFAYARAEWGETEIFNANTNENEYETDRNRQTLGAKYEHDFSERLYGYAKQDFEVDEFQSLDLRSTTAAGGGYQILEEEKHKLNAEAGIGWETNEYENSRTGSTIAEIGENWTWLISEDWKFIQTFLMIANIEDIQDDFFDYRTVTTADLRHQLTGNLYLALGLEHRYYSEPAREVSPRTGLLQRLDRQDWIASIKLGWTF